MCRSLLHLEGVKGIPRRGNSMCRSCETSKPRELQISVAGSWRHSKGQPEKSLKGLLGRVTGATDYGRFGSVGGEALGPLGVFRSAPLAGIVKLH